MPLKIETLTSRGISFRSTTTGEFKILDQDLRSPKQITEFFGRGYHNVIKAILQDRQAATIILQNQDLYFAYITTRKPDGLLIASTAISSGRMLLDTLSLPLEIYPDPYNGDLISRGLKLSFVDKP